MFLGGLNNYFYSKIFNLIISNFSQFNLILILNLKIYWHRARYFILILCDYFQYYFCGGILGNYNLMIILCTNFMVILRMNFMIILYYNLHLNLVLLNLTYFSQILDYFVIFKLFDI